jgi:hypothetical protein
MAGLALVLPAAGHAQRILDPGRDATLPRPGEVRLTTGGSWDVFDTRFDADGRREPLGSPLLGNPMPGSFAPLYAQALANRSGLLGTADEPLSAGVMDGVLEARNWTVPFNVEIGLTRWLALELDLPVRRTRTGLFLRPNPPGTFANLGVNPAFTNADARQRATQLYEQLAATRTQIETARPECFGTAPAPSCRGVLAAWQRVHGLALGVDATYRRGWFVPLNGSRADSLTRANLAGVNADVRALLGLGADPITAVPSGAPARLAAGTLAALFGDAAYGIGVDSLAGIGRLGLGDAAAGLRLKWIDTFGSDPARRATADGFRVRSVVHGAVRVGTGQPAVPGQWADLGTGTDALSLDVGGVLDVQATQWLWLSAAARTRRVLGDERRPLWVAFASDGAVPPATQVFDALVTRGAVTQLGVIPRVILSANFGLSGEWQHLRRDDDRFAFADAALASALGPVSPAGLDGLLSRGGTAQRVGVGATYSTVASALGTRGLPIELSYRHLVTTSGTNLPRVVEDVLALRLYWAPFARR